MLQDFKFRLIVGNYNFRSIYSQQPLNKNGAVLIFPTPIGQLDLPLLNDPDCSKDAILKQVFPALYLISDTIVVYPLGEHSDSRVRLFISCG